MTFFLFNRPKAVGFLFPHRSFLLVLLFSCFYFPIVHAQTHPFLLVKQQDYPALRQKAAIEPFKSMVQIARDRHNSTPGTTDWNGMASTLAYNSLLYVLEDNNSRKAEYRRKVLSLINTWSERVPKLGTNHGSTVYAANAAVNSIIALDVMYQDFSDQERTQAEAQMTKVARFYIANKLASGKKMAWKLAQLGFLAIYQIYHGDQDKIAAAVKEYKEYLLDKSVSSDGSWMHSPGYWFARLAENRVAKTNAIDVIQKTGHYDFYGDSRMKKLIDWGNHFVFTPAGTFNLFGETFFKEDEPSRSPLLYHTEKYGEKAGRNSSWIISKVKKRIPANGAPDFFTFVLMPEKTPRPEMPTSLLMKNTGAALWGRTDSKEALEGVLYSLVREPNTRQDHESEDVNSINLTAYGEYMLVNAGANYAPSYPGQTPDGNAWTEAWLQSVILMGNNKRHENEHGGGLTDGLVGGSVEFGTTHSGPAIANTEHKRSLFLVHPAEGRSSGYFLLRDFVNSSNGDQPHTVLQLNTRKNGVTEVKTDKEYTAKINGHVTKNAAGDEKVAIFFATPPNGVTKGTAWKGKPNFESEYLKASYDLDNKNQTRFATVIFPEDNSHTRAKMERIAGIECDGALISHDERLLDHFLVADESVEKASYEDVSFRGESLFYRTDANVLTSFCLVGGRLFDKGENVRQGFEADDRVSIQMDDLSGSIRANKSTKVTFFQPNVKGVILNGELLSMVGAGADFVTVNIPAGLHRIELSASISSEPVSVSGISLDKEEITLEIDKSIQLNATVLPYNATNKNLLWSSNNPDVAGVDENGVITVHDYGVTTVKVQSEETDASASVRICVPESRSKNLAFQRTATASVVSHDEYAPSEVIDGNTSDESRWSAHGFPQWFEVDLGRKIKINRTELVALHDRAYQYYIEVKRRKSDDYVKIIDRTENLDPAAAEKPLADLLCDPVDARFVRITVTGLADNSSSWVSLIEFGIFSPDINPFIGIKDKWVIAQQSGFTVYPNPSKGRIFLQHHDPVLVDQTIFISDALGRQVWSGNYHLNSSGEALPIDLSHLNSGLYIISSKINGIAVQEKLMLVK